jgi:acyl-CoA reductase-like NAD-dependent aldehyde dehydrogenase
MRTYSLLIDGERVDTDEQLDVTSPYSGEVVGRVGKADASHAERAVEAARRALADVPAQHERAAILERARNLVVERAEDLARSITEESGKPISTARAEAARCADTLTFAAVETRKLAGTMVPFAASEQGAGKLGYTLLQPKGIVAAITPFNFPLNLVCHKLAPAFAAGCPVVLKPAGVTPLTAYALADILLEAGVPSGFLHVLTGSSSDIGPVITGAADVISFTGSTEVGFSLQDDNPRTPVLMELGNNTPVIIDASADVERAAAKIAKTGYSFAGQSCISAQRVYVHQQVKDAFLEALITEVSGLKVGDPMDDDTDVGPLIRDDDRERVLAWIAEAVDAGAKLRLGGEANDDGTVQPTILDDVTPDMKVSCEEVFGPVLALQSVADVDEGIALANDTRYGLQAGIFTGDLDAALRASQQLQFGGVTVNESPTFRADQQPYGGVGDSGNTREGPAWSIHDYLTERVVIVEQG